MYVYILGLPGGISDKEPTCQCRRHDMWVWSLDQEDPLEESMATHSSIFAWRIPWTAWWVTVHGVAKSWTWLKWLSINLYILYVCKYASVYFNYMYVHINRYTFLFFSFTPLECKLCLEILVIVLQLLCRVRLFVTPWTAACQLPCPSLSPWVCSNSCLLSQWCIQSSHPLSPTSPLALNHSQYQGLFQRVGPSHQVAKVLELQLQHRSFQWIFRVDFL